MIAISGRSVNLSEGDYKMAMTCEKAFAVLDDPAATETEKAAAQAFVDDAANGCDVDDAMQHTPPTPTPSPTPTPTPS